MLKQLNQINISEILNIAREAGGAILEVYESDEFDIEKKSDDSPLTRADKASHQIIKNRLKDLYPEIPLLSEEGKEIPYQDRKNWEQFWLVDPLDGTKEFIKRNGEFTVNIALIQQEFPVLGVIFAPVLQTSWFAKKGSGSFKLLNDGRQEILMADKNIADGIISVQSRSHSSREENDILSKFPVSKAISIGSSLKFCKLAEGEAHLYYRHGPTWEWDTAAGHAIALEAGCQIISGKQTLFYNKKIIKNGSFFVLASEALKKYLN